MIRAILRRCDAAGLLLGAEHDRGELGQLLQPGALRLGVVCRAVRGEARGLHIAPVGREREQRAIREITALSSLHFLGPRAPSVDPEVR